MTLKSRLTLLGAAALIAIVALVLLRPADRERESAVRADDPTASLTPSSDSPGTATGDGKAARSSGPRLPLLTPENPRTIRVRQGNTIRFAVRSNSDDEIHVHGYDVSRPAPAGRTVRMSVEANLTGVFEVELEQSETSIGELEVRP